MNRSSFRKKAWEEGHPLGEIERLHDIPLTRLALVGTEGSRLWDIFSFL